MKITAFLFLLLTSIFILAHGRANTEITTSVSDSARVCIVSGETIEGEGVNYKYLDKKLSFCCEGCLKKFSKEPANYLKGGLKCPVCDEDDASRDLFSVVNGVKYYFCSNGCKEKFDLDPGMYFNQFNK